MTRFVVRPTSCYESDGYSVYDTNREDERGQQIGRGLRKNEAIDLSVLLNGLDANGDERIREVLGFCADAHDDYLSDEEQRAAREAHEKSAEQASKMPRALRLCLSALTVVVQIAVASEDADDAQIAEFDRMIELCEPAVAAAREALGE